VHVSTLHYLNKVKLWIFTLNKVKLWIFTLNKVKLWIFALKTYGDMSCVQYLEII
jgi:hypothetical protein